MHPAPNESRLTAQRSRATRFAIFALAVTLVSSLTALPLAAQEAVDVVGDRAEVKEQIREAGFDEIRLIDADGNLVE